MTPPTLQEQIEACEHAAEWPRSGLNMAWCVKLAAAAATLRELQKNYRRNSQGDWVALVKVAHGTYTDDGYTP